VALAEFDAGSEETFVFRMNEKARGLGLKDTHFSNVKGFDEDSNYSTAYDTMMFGRAALEYPFIRKTVARKSAEVTSASGKIKHRLESTNELLENPHFKVVGLKTGRTPAAGQSFVSLMEGPNGHEILTVLLDSPDRFKETKIVLDWVLRNYEFP
jgi:D-alanyl-D-alanine carboxypeptidase